MMPFVVVLALVMLSALCLFLWRWLQMVEQVKVAREKAGGAELARTVAALTERVAQIDTYLNPTSYDIEGGFDKWLLDNPERPHKNDPPFGRPK